jgi:LacI family transcriptional regulator, repressor for deo operon, udp, cdd, tsx, nupC, and nupG
LNQEQRPDFADILTLKAAFRPTLSDVAKLAGVSVATASRALSNPDLVAENTRNTVRDAAASCGYKINLVARSLRLQRTNTVLVLVPAFDNHFYPDVLRAMEEVAHDEGFSMILGLTGKKQHRERNYLDLVVTQRVDGLIALDDGVNQIAQSAAGMSVPMVQVLEGFWGDRMPMIGVDNGSLAAGAVHHLLGLGHRRIAHIAGLSGSIVAQQRRDGYAAALREGGLEYDEALVVRGDYRHEPGLAAMRQLLSMAEPPTAVFCANDASALGAMRACRMAGLRVPADISIVGVDDIEDAALCDPPLTTVRQPRGEIGRIAMEILIRAIRGQRVENSLILPTELIIRETTARPAAA